MLFLAVIESSFYYCSTGIYLYIYSTGQDVLRYSRCCRGTVAEGADCCFLYHIPQNSHHPHKRRSICHCMEVFQHQTEILSIEDILTSWSHRHNTLLIIIIWFLSLGWVNVLILYPKEVEGNQLPPLIWDGKEKGWRTTSSWLHLLWTDWT